MSIQTQAVNIPVGETFLLDGQLCQRLDEGSTLLTGFPEGHILYSVLASGGLALVENIVLVLHYPVTVSPG